MRPNTQAAWPFGRRAMTLIEIYFTGRGFMFYRDKTCVVTGGTGFIGGHITRHLLQQGARVRVIAHQRADDWPHENVEVVRADLSQQDDCLRALADAECVFHCAGAVSAAGVTVGRGANPMAPITINTVLTAQVLQAAWTRQVERILIFSSSTGYPDVAHPVREEEMWDAPPATPYFGYGWSRRYMEVLAEFVTRRSDTKVAICRPTAVYGPHDNFDPATSHVIPALIHKAVTKMNPFEVWGTGEDIRDSLHVDDLARGCLLLLQKHAECDPVNIGLGQGHSVRELVEIILAAAGHNDVELNFDASRPTTIPVRLADVSKARDVLGFEPRISLRDGITDTVKWYQTHIG